MRGRVEISGINTAKLPVLKNDEMTALLRRAHAGDTAAREQLICGNLRLVLSVLQRFAGRGESADDLFQVGCIGLMKAIDNFDVDIPREDVVFAMDAFSDPVSLYEPLYADSGDTVCVMDQVRDEKNTDESWLDRIALKDAIARLDPRQRSILALRFCQGKTQMEVSSEIGISQAQVSRLEKTALSSIRKNM